MGFRGYKFKYKLIVFQNFQDREDPSSLYAKNFEITLFISSTKTKLMRFDEIDAIIEKTIGKYSKKVLDQIPPFNELEPTLENMGSVFYQFLKKDLTLAGASLAILEINESPVRTFIVNEANTQERLIIGDKKINVSSLLVENVISQSITNLISDFEEEEQISASAIPTPEAPIEAEAPLAATKTIIKNNSCEIELYKKVPVYGFVFSFLILVLCGSFVSIYLKNVGAYPSGADIYGHLFKSDLLYHSILKGDLFPLYTDLWYNGMQPFRYWAPLPYYILAILHFFAGGSATSAYLLFVALAIIVGGTGWLLWGLTYNRMTFCTFLAVLWFFMPDNMRVFFVEGNLPRMVIAMLLPYLFYFVWMFVEHCKRWAVIPIVIMMCLITLCHAMIAAMTGITTFIFLFIYCIGQKRWQESIYTICAMLLSFALCGIWLYPAFQGGLLGMDASATAEVMKALSTPSTISLNPFLRNQGKYELFYFGTSVLILSIIGLFLANRKSRPGFYTVIIIFLGSTPAFVPFLEKLPLNQLFWMTRFTPIVYVLFLISILEWKKCRRYAVLLIAFVIVLDCIPSLDMERSHSQTPAVFKYTLDEA
ncbi:MAG: 6-pyruvoyl-tetrahydropterin synthase-related protein, partial [Bacillota bacterium]